MALDFKKITEVTLQDTVTENTNVYIEENGEIKRVSASELGGAGVSSWNDLTDKPFGEEEGIEVLVEEQTISGFTLNRDTFYTVAHPLDFPFVEGDMYVVTWDGNEYECQAFYDGSSFYANAIGNENYINMQSGGDIPFTIVLLDGEVLIITESIENSHTISIVHSGKILHKIDQKYLPLMSTLLYVGEDSKLFKDEECTIPVYSYDIYDDILIGKIPYIVGPSSTSIVLSCVPGLRGCSVIFYNKGSVTNYVYTHDFIAMST